jgi:hypothetical protein
MKTNNTSNKLFETNEEVFDALETMVLLALDGDKHAPVVGNPTKRFSGDTYVLCDQGNFIGLKNKVPSNFYTFDMTDDSRLYTTDKRYLMNNYSIFFL